MRVYDIIAIACCVAQAIIETLMVLSYRLGAGRLVAGLGAAQHAFQAALEEVHGWQTPVSGRGVVSEMQRRRHTVYAFGSTNYIKSKQLFAPCI